MNRNALRYLALALAPFIFAACDQVSDTVPQAPTLSSDAQHINGSLDSMAKLFAQAVTDKGLRGQLHAQVAQRFDGDTNVLYKTLSASSEVRRELAGAYSRGLNVQAGDALSAIDRLAAAIPRFQVAVPAKFETWDAASYTPLVGFMPVGVEDTELKTITAYDAQGRAHTLDAQGEPSRPVIVLGLSERTDDAGNVRQDFMSTDEASQTLSAQGRYEVRMVKVRIHNDNEPWPKGDAEVMLVSSGTGLWYHAGFNELNNSGDQISYNRILGTTTGGVYFFWYEDDGGSLDVTVSVKGVSLGIKIDDDDDWMGGTYLSNGYFAGGTDNERDLGDLTQWTD